MRAAPEHPAGRLGRGHGPGEPGTVQQMPLVRFGDQVLRLVVGPVGGLHSPQMDGYAVFLGRHHTQAGGQRRQ